MDCNEISKKVDEQLALKSLIDGELFNSDIEAIGFIDMEFTEIKGSAYDIGEMIKYFKDSIRAEDDEWGTEVLLGLYTKTIILTHDLIDMATSIKKAIKTKENKE